jgi:hypothetical protein
VETRLRCGNESEVFVHMGRFKETSAYPIDGCRACVVPVLRSPSGEANARDYRKLVSDGFLLTWHLPPRKFARQIIFPWISLIEPSDQPCHYPVSSGDVRRSRQATGALALCFLQI